MHCHTTTLQCFTWYFCNDGGETEVSSKLSSQEFDGIEFKELLIFTQMVFVASVKIKTLQLLLLQRFIAKCNLISFRYFSFSGNSKKSN